MPFIAPVTGFLAGKTFLAGLAKALLFQTISSFAISALTGRKRAGNTDRTITRNEPAPAQLWVFGKTKVTDGAIFFQETRGDYLYVGIVIASHEIAAVEKIFIGDREVIYGADGWAIAGDFKLSQTSFVQVSVRLGKEDQLIDPIIAADFPEYGNAGTFKQRGLATIVLKMYYGANSDDHNAVWGGGGLEISAVVCGLKCWNWINPASLLADRNTWILSDNPVVVFGNFLHASGILDFSKQDLVWNSGEALAAQETFVNKNGVVEIGLTINGSFLVDGSYSDVFANFGYNDLIAFGFNNGLLRMFLWRDKTAVETLDFTEIYAFSAPSAASLENLLPVVVGDFFDGGANYSQAQTDEIVDDNLVNKIGDKITSFNLPFLNTKSSAMRALWLTQTRQNKGVKITISCAASAYRFELFDVVQIANSLVEWLNGKWVVKKIEYRFDDGDFPVVLELESLKSAFFSYNANNVEGVATANPIALSADGINVFNLDDFSVTTTVGENNLTCQFSFTEKNASIGYVAEYFILHLTPDDGWVVVVNVIAKAVSNGTLVTGTFTMPSGYARPLMEFYVSARVSGNRDIVLGKYLEWRD